MQKTVNENASFEAFGEHEPHQYNLAINENIADRDFDDAEEVDVIDNAALKDEPHVIDPIIAKEVKTGFSWAGFGGVLAALAWIGCAVGGPISFYGLDAVLAMDPAMQAGLIALAFGPAILLWLGGCAAGEAFKARCLTAHLTRVAQDPDQPLAIGEARAKKLSDTVKTEIDTLNDAVAAALTRLSELESAAQRNAAIFDNAIAASRDNAQHMTDTLARERESIAQLNSEMRSQTDMLSHSVGRQVRLMREASTLAKTEMEAAEGAMQTHLSAFASSADVMSERTAAFHEAADHAHHAASSLNNTMGVMLDGLGEATKLTDAARQSAAQAQLAATETATAVNEATQRAVHDAKRAAQFIRSETEAMQDAAVDTMSRLQAAADAARAASAESQAAADRHAQSIEKRLAALASTAKAAKAAPAPVAAPVAAPARVAAQPAAPQYPKPVVAQAPRPAAARVQEPQRAPEQRVAEPAHHSDGWTKPIPSTRYAAAQPSRPTGAPGAFDAFALADFGATAPQRDPDAELKNGAIELIVASGVDIDQVLGASELERIAQRSRHGLEARRRAVYDAAPTAVNRIARHLKRLPEARKTAAAFHARPDLAKSDKHGEGPDMVKAYLLLDAVLD